MLRALERGSWTLVEPQRLALRQDGSLRENADDAEVVPPALCGHRDDAPPVYPPVR